LQVAQPGAIEHPLRGGSGAVPSAAAAAAKVGLEHLTASDELEQPARDEQVDEREHGQRHQVVDSASWWPLIPPPRAKA